MPKIPVDECPAGPAMDAAVAGALGLKVQWRASTRAPVRPGWYAVYLAGIYANEYDGWAEHEDWRPVLPYSADIAAAWELVEKIAQDGWRLELEAKLLHCHGIRSYSAAFDRLRDDDTDFVYGSADTAPLAICRAFLKVNGVEHIEVPE